jgi:hypothetical protein
MFSHHPVLEASPNTSEAGPVAERSIKTPVRGGKPQGTTSHRALRMELRAKGHCAQMHWG